MLPAYLSVSVGVVDTQRHNKYTNSKSSSINFPNLWQIYIYVRFSPHP